MDMEKTEKMEMEKMEMEKMEKMERIENDEHLLLLPPHSYQKRKIKIVLRISVRQSSSSKKGFAHTYLRTCT